MFSIWMHRLQMISSTEAILVQFFYVSYKTSWIHQKQVTAVLTNYLTHIGRHACCVTKALSNLSAQFMHDLRCNQ